MPILHPMLNTQDKILNGLGYIPVVGNFSGSFRIYLAIQAIRTTRQNISGENLSFKQKYTLYSPHLGHIARGAFENVPVISTLFFLIHDHLKAKLLVWAPESLSQTKIYSSPIALGHDFNILNAYLLKREVKRQSLEIINNRSGITRDGIKFYTSVNFKIISQIQVNNENPLKKFGFVNEEIPELLRSYISHNKAICLNMVQPLQPKPIVSY